MWFLDTPVSLFQRFCIDVIKCGEIPRHLAIIMDGNRRFATKNNIKKAAGHKSGFDKLAQTLQWCFELGVREVTIYAFSIENFKRSEDEVAALMDLAREKYRNLLEEREKLRREGIRVRVVGNLELIPEDIRKSIAKAMLMTRDNKKLFLNVGFAYTSRDEIEASVKTIVEGVRNNQLDIEDVDEKLIGDCLYTCESPEPDLIIRTSGEVRFSDFLLWQIGNSQVYFTDILWPEFSLWHLLGVIFMYQREVRNRVVSDKGVSERSDAVKKFLKSVEEKRWSQLELYANS